MRSGQTGGWGSWALGLGVAVALAVGLAGVAGAANIWVVDGNTFPPTFTNIQDAIDFASPGDTIIVRSTEDPYGAVVIDKDNLTVVGEGDTEIEPGSTCADDSNFAVLIQASGVRFQGFRLTGTDCGGIDVTGSDNWVVANWIEDAGGDGIRLDGDSKRNTVLGNWITNPNGNGAVVQSESTGWGHLFAYNVVSGAGESGIEFEVPKVTLDYNVAVFNDEDGIGIDTNDAKQFKVTNNIALDNNQDSSEDDDADLDRDSRATGTFKKNVFETCKINGGSLSTCPAF